MSFSMWMVHVVVFLAGFDGSSLLDGCSCTKRLGMRTRNVELCWQYVFIFLCECGNILSFLNLFFFFTLRTLSLLCSCMVFPFARIFSFVKCYYYYYSFTKSSAITNFHIIVETIHEPDRGQQENVIAFRFLAYDSCLVFWFLSFLRSVDQDPLQTSNIHPLNNPPLPSPFF